MISASFRLTHRPAFQSFRLACLFGIALAAMFVSGCGGGNGSGSTLSGNTSVVVLVSSTANDQISQLYLTLASLTLTSQSGKTITVFSTPQNAELMHLNGTAEPLATVMVPQDVYTSATAAFEFAEPSNAPLCVGQNTAAEENLFNRQIQLSLNPTVSVPSPITVTGAAMGLALDLAVAPVQAIQLHVHVRNELRCSDLQSDSCDHCGLAHQQHERKGHEPSRVDQHRHCQWSQFQRGWRGWSVVAS